MNSVELAYTDRPGSCLIYEKNITGPGSYRFFCPKKFGKIFIHLVASIVGMDHAIELESDNESSSSASYPTPSKIRGLSDKREGQRQSNEKKQSITRNFQSRNGEVNSRFIAGKSAFSLPSEVRAIPKLEGLRSKILVELQDKGGSKAAVTPSPKPPTSPGYFGFSRSSNVSSISGLPAENVIQNYIVKSAPKRIPTVAPEPRQNFAANPLAPKIDNFGEHHSQGRHLHQLSMTSLSKQDDKGVRGSDISAWNHVKRKQRLAQQRAFTRKNDNPFTFYQHDPNDAESYLESLSSERNDKSSIIPPRELDALRINSNSSRKPYVTHRSLLGRFSEKRRRGASQHETLTNLDLLRMKAAEHEAYSQLSAQPPLRHSLNQATPLSTTFAGISPAEYDRRNGNVMASTRSFNENDSFSVMYGSHLAPQFPSHGITPNSSFPGDWCARAPSTRQQTRDDSLQSWDNPNLHVMQGCHSALNMFPIEDPGTPFLEHYGHALHDEQFYHRSFDEMNPSSWIASDSASKYDDVPNRWSHHTPQTHDTFVDWTNLPIGAKDEDFSKAFL